MSNKNTKIETLTITIDRFDVHQGPKQNYYSGPTYKTKNYSLVKNVELEYKLNIRGTDSQGRRIAFMTPGSEVNKATGMLNYIKLHDDRKGWFTEKKGEMIGHKNALYYEGSREMPVAIEDKSEIVPAFGKGDQITITGLYVGSFGKIRFYQRVKRIS